MKRGPTGRHGIALAGLGLLALAVRLPLSPLHAYRWTGGTDAGEYKTWAQAIRDHGVLNVFRDSPTDYIGYNWFLWLVSLAYRPLGQSYSDSAIKLHLLIKAPPLLFDAALIAMVYVVTRAFVTQARRDEGALRRSPETLALAAAAVVALHPASVYDSAVWAQIDAQTAVTMLASIFFIVRRMPVAAGAVWGAGFVIKPQPIVIAPLLAVLAFGRGDWRSLVKMTAAGLAAGVLTTLPWLLHGDLLRIGRIYKTLANEDVGRLSGNAFNVWWFVDVASHPVPRDRLIGPVTYRMAGTALTAVAVLLALAYAWAKANLERALIAGAYLTFAFYMLSTSSTDRYLYPLFALLPPVLMLERRWLWMYLPLSATFMLTLIISAPPSRGWAHGQLDSPLTLAAAAVNCVLFAAFTVIIARGALPAARDLRSLVRQRTVLRPDAVRAE